MKKLIFSFYKQHISSGVFEMEVLTCGLNLGVRLDQTKFE